MNFLAIHHEPKSNFAYVYKEDTLHIRIRTEKKDIDKISILATDPFNWLEDKDGNSYFNISAVKKIPMLKDYADEIFDYWFAEINGFKHLRIKYLFVLEKNNYKVMYGPHRIEKYTEELFNQEDFINNFYNFPFISKEDIFNPPKWVKDSVWYQIFPERFANYNNLSKSLLTWDSTSEVKLDMFFGGNLEGIISRLDYIQDLGINGIYLTPIFKSPSTHKYDTIDYFNIDEDFGNNIIFKRLVKEAHKRGIKVMLDAVFNHCGYLHPYWQDVLEFGKDSKYYKYFHILKEPSELKLNEKGMPIELNNDEKTDLYYRTFAFTPNMPKWNIANKEVQKYLISIGEYWIKEFDIDGWRLDVSNEVSHSFWREFRKAVKEVKEDVYIVGENWDNSYPWLQGDQFDSVMNYTFSNILWESLNRNKNKRSHLRYQDKLSKLLISYPKNVSENLLNIIDTHDTSRIMTICNNNIDKVKLAFLLQFTFCGAPCVYYGSEIGLRGEGDMNRQCMPWDESKHNLELKNHVKKLIDIRKQYDSTKSVDIRFINNKNIEEELTKKFDYLNILKMNENLKEDKLFNNIDNFICFEKKSNSEILIVLINNTGTYINVDIPNELKNRHFIDIYNNVNFYISTSISFKPYGFYMLVKV